MTHAGADLNAIRMRVEGADALAMRTNGLGLTTAIGKFTLPLPLPVGVDGKPLPPAAVAKPTLTGSEIAAPFATANATALSGTSAWDLIYSTFLNQLGGSVSGVGDDISIAVDASGAAYVSGTTATTDFPSTAGPFNYAGGQKAFVTKLDATGDALVYAVLIGGDQRDWGGYITVDSGGAAYITGRTGSADFPTTTGAYQPVLKSTGDPSPLGNAFVTKLNADGNNLVYSTFLGGSVEDYGEGIAVDANGLASVCGTTYSPDFPVASNAYQKTLPGNEAVFVTRLNADGSNLVYSTLLGGSYANAPDGIALDSSGFAYVAGWTTSPDFPVTQGAFQTQYTGQGLWFVTKLNADGSGLAYSTFLGGSGTQYNGLGNAIAVDANGAAYVTGGTTSSNFPTTTTAYQRTFQGTFDAYVTKLKPDGSGLVYSTFLGTDRAMGYGIAVDHSGAAYVTGITRSAGFPTTPGVFQPIFGGGSQDAFVAKLSADGSNLLYSTFLGGSGNDMGLGSAVDPNGVIVVTGYTDSSDFPTTPGAFQQTFGQFAYAYATKINPADTRPPLPASFTYNSSPATGNLLADPRATCPVSCAQEDTQYFRGGPINTFTGGEDYTVVDLSFPALGGQMVFQRSYSSLTTSIYTTTLGYGWTHNQDTRLILPTDLAGVSGEILFKPHNANQLIFTINGDGTYTPYAGVLAKLVATTSPAGYRVTAADQSTYAFDATGRLLTWSDAQGHTWSYAYDGAGRLTRVQDSSGLRYLNLGYDANGRLTSVSDPFSRTVQYGYDANGDLATFTDARSNTWTYHYDGTSHRLSQVINPLNNTVERTEYDTQGRAVRQFNALNVKTLEIQYNADNTRVITDAVGSIITTTYDTRGTLAKLRDAAGQTQKEFDVNFRPAEIIDPNNNTTNMSWSADGADLTKVVDAQGRATSLAYDSLNNLTRTVDALGRVSNFAYSGKLLTQSTDALGNTTTYSYTAEGFLAAQTDARGNTTSYGYNQFGQRTSVTDTLNNVTHFDYDAVGRLSTTTDALGRVTLNEYDNDDNLVKVTQNYVAGQSQNYQNQYNIVTQYGYDTAGRRTTVTDTLGRVTKNEYDAAGRLVKVAQNYQAGQSQNYQNEYNLITTYGYDDMGRQTLITDTAGHATRNTYDSAGRLATVTQNYVAGQPQNYQNQYNLVTTSAYDAAGNVTTRTDTLGRQTVTQYDALNRPIKVIVNYVDGVFDATKPDEDLITSTTYDAVGNVATTTDPLGHVTRTDYDALNRPSTVTTNYAAGQSQNYQNQYNIITQYGYDGVGNRVTTTDTLGRVTRSEYDALNRAYRVTQNYVAGQVQNYQNEFNLVTTYGFNAVGSRVSATDTLGRVTRSEYDALDRVTAQIDAANQRTQYTYDALGNRTSVLDAQGRTTSSDYDSLNRLIKTTQPLSTITQYGYDALGNRTRVTDPRSNATQYGYDAVNRNTSITDALSHTATTTYDAAGRRVAQTDALGDTTTFGYDLADRQTTVVDAQKATRRGINTTRLAIVLEWSMRTAWSRGTNTMH